MQKNAASSITLGVDIDLVISSVSGGIKVMGQVTSSTTLDLFSAARSKDLSKLINQQIGEPGENIARVFLIYNKHTDICILQNLPVEKV